MKKPSFLSCSVLLAVFTTVFLGGCASTFTKKTPDYFPNEKFQRAGPMAAKADEAYCMSLADEYVKEPNRYMDVLKQGAIGGAVGAGAGAVGGTIMGSNPGRSTGAGAAIGGILGVLKASSEFNDRSPNYERFVEHCMQKKGYEIIGWSSK